LWIKIWEASIILADYLAGLNFEPEKRFLEIGCGLGLVGIVASAFGHHVTITEYNQDALNFARANALLNKVSNIEIKEMNWNKPQLQGSFDCIIGSEIIYKESDFQSILSLFRTYLKDGGEIILAEGIRKTSMKFMRQMGDSFNIKAQKRIFRSKDREIMVMLCRMRLKS
jgi:16S rRNA G1207 methylase RsmC